MHDLMGGFMSLQLDEEDKTSKSEHDLYTFKEEDKYGFESYFNNDKDRNSIQHSLGIYLMT